MNGRAIGLPGWKIIRTIGKGSFGCVYEVEKEGEFGAVVHSALKVISIPETDAEIKAYRDDGYDDASLTKLFQSRVEDITAEFELMSKLKGDSHIVSYEDHSIVQHDNDPGYDIYIRMELLTGLPDYINRQYPGRRVPDAAVAQIGADVCRALERCKQHRIIHRDIKPQNIFVNENGDFKLGDFGIAKTSDHTTKATKTGTYGYMAPEVYLGKPYNASVDLYSLGIVLYWMLNERRGPFYPLPPEIPTSEQSAAALDRRMHGEPLPAPKHGSDALRRVVLKACAYDPKDRYPGPEAMRRDLMRISVGADTASEMTLTTGAASDANQYDKTVGLFTTGKDRRPDHYDAEATIGLFTAQPGAAAKRDTGNDRDGIRSDATGEGTAARKQAERVKTESGAQKQPEPNNSRQKRIWIAAAATAAIIGIALIAFLLWDRACGQTQSRTGVISTPTAKPTTAIIQESTTPEPAAAPAPVPVTVTYSLDEYCSDHGMRSETKYTSEIGSNIGCMWRSWNFFGTTGRIEVAGRVRSNALLFYTDNKNKKEIVIDGASYIGMQGYFTLENDGYETLTFTLGAASAPDRYYGPVSSHGWYRVQIYAGDERVLKTDWMDYADIGTYSVDITGASTVKVVLEQTYGSDYDADKVNYALNIVMYDAQFTKTQYLP